VVERGHHDTSTVGGTSTALTEAQRAEALGEYAAAILAPALATIERLHAETRDQAELIGQLRAQLAAADAKTADSANLDSPRPWWQRWLWWRRP
jgi:hypothetical protein